MRLTFSSIFRHSPLALFRHLFFILLITGPSLHAVTASELYMHKCAKCHGINGQHKALGSSRMIGGLESGSIAEALHAYKENRRNQTGRGTIMRGLAAELSDAEIEMLADFIAAMK